MGVDMARARLIKAANAKMAHEKREKLMQEEEETRLYALEAQRIQEEREARKAKERAYKDERDSMLALMNNFAHELVETERRAPSLKTIRNLVVNAKFENLKRLRVVEECKLREIIDQIVAHIERRVQETAELQQEVKKLAANIIIDIWEELDSFHTQRQATTIGRTRARKRRAIPIFFQRKHAWKQVAEIMFRVPHGEVRQRSWQLLREMVNMHRRNKAYEAWEAKQQLVSEGRAAWMIEDQNGDHLRSQSAAKRKRDEEEKEYESTPGYKDYAQPMRTATNTLFRAKGSLEDFRKWRIGRLSKQRTNWRRTKEEVLDVLRSLRGKSSEAFLISETRILSHNTGNAILWTRLQHLVESVETTLADIVDDLTMFGDASSYECLLLDWHFKRFSETIEAVSTFGHEARQLHLRRLQLKSSDPHLRLITRMRYDHSLTHPLFSSSVDWADMAALTSMEFQWFPPSASPLKLVDVKRYTTLQDFNEEESLHGIMAKEMHDVACYAKAKHRDGAAEWFMQKGSRRLLLTELSNESLAHQLFYKRIQPLLNHHRRVIEEINAWRPPFTKLIEEIDTKIAFIKRKYPVRGLIHSKLDRRRDTYFHWKNNLASIRTTWMNDIFGAINEAARECYELLNRPSYADRLAEAAPQLHSWFVQELANERDAASGLPGLKSRHLAKKHPQMMKELDAIEHGLELEAAGSSPVQHSQEQERHPEQASVPIVSPWKQWWGKEDQSVEAEGEKKPKAYILTSREKTREDARRKARLRTSERHKRARIAELRQVLVKDQESSRDSPTLNTPQMPSGDPKIIELSEREIVPEDGGERDESSPMLHVANSPPPDKVREESSAYNFRIARTSPTAASDHEAPPAKDARNPVRAPIGGDGGKRTSRQNDGQSRSKSVPYESKSPPRDREDTRPYAVKNFKPSTTAALGDKELEKKDLYTHHSFRPSDPKHAPYSSFFSKDPPSSEPPDHQVDSLPNSTFSEAGRSEADPGSVSGEDLSDPEFSSEIDSASDPESNSENESVSSSGEDSDAPSEDEIYTPLDFQIPADAMREAMLASPGTPASFWSHKLYRGSADEKVTVHYCRSKETGETVAKLFLGKPVLGFDIEWKPQANAAAGLKSNVSLIQLACEDRVGLFHIALHKGETPEEVLPPTLREIIASPDVMKTGVAILADFSRVAKFLDTQARGIIELSHWHRLITYSEHNPKLVNKRLVSLAAQVEIHLHLPLSKGDVRTSDWSKQLNHEQCSYAAADAYASYRLYEALEEKRIAMNPRPPRPQFAELKLPIKLADRVVVESSSDGDLADAVNEAEELSGELENLTLNSNSRSIVMDENITDEELLAIESAAQDQDVKDLTEGTSDIIKYPELPPFDDYTESPPARLVGRVRLANTLAPTTTSPPTKSKAPRKPRTPKSTSTLPSTEQSELLAAATTWADSQTDPVPTSTQPHHREGRKAGTTWLKCYYLWHHEGLELDEVAKVVRDPPLKKGTVASYVAEAVGYGGCEGGDLERLGKVLEQVPMQAWGRFRKLRKEVEEGVVGGEGKDRKGKEKVVGDDEDVDGHGHGDGDGDEWVV